MELADINRTLNVDLCTHSRYRYPHGRVWPFSSLALSSGSTAWTSIANKEAYRDYLQKPKWRSSFQPESWCSIDIHEQNDCSFPVKIKGVPCHGRCVCIFVCSE